MEFSECVESSATSLVREFLCRKGLKQTLDIMDHELPRSARSISNSSNLVKELKIKKLFRKNRASQKPYKSVLEVIVHQIKHGNRYKKCKKERLHLINHSTSTLLTLSPLKTLHNYALKRGNEIHFLTLIKDNCSCMKRHLYYERNAQALSLNTFKLKEQPSGKSNGIQRDVNGEPMVEFDHKFYYSQKDPQQYRQKEESPLTDKEKILKSSLNPQDSTVEEESFTHILRTEMGYLKTQDKNKEIMEPSGQQTLNTDRSTNSPIDGCLPKSQRNSFDEEAEKRMNNNQNYSVDVTVGEADEETYLNGPTAFNLNVEDIDTSPVDFQEKFPKQTQLYINLDSNVTCNNGLNQSTCSVLKKMLLANNKWISSKWLGESFIFRNNTNISYGFMQHKEGSNGVLASVNAYVIKELLFAENTNEVELLRPEKSQLKTALVKAFISILWKAGSNTATLAVLENNMTEINSIEEVVDNAKFKSFTTIIDLEQAINDNYLSFSSPNGYGCLLLLISAVISRGVENVVEDMNGALSLINSDGFSSLELVNLLLTGQAVSNVFDKIVKLKYSILRGISKRSDIGYLSLKEHFQCCKVGSYLKTPRYPIWILHSEDHCTVLFSCQKQLVSDWKVERKFVLYHYDTLNKVGDETQLIIDTTRAEESNLSIDCINLTLERCIHTKWKDADITWKTIGPKNN